jgi:hypothetical protein
MNRLNKIYHLALSLLVVVSVMKQTAQGQLQDDPLFYLYPEKYVQALDCSATCTWMIRQYSPGPYGSVIEVQPIVQVRTINYGPAYFRIDRDADQKVILQKASTDLLGLCQKNEWIAKLSNEKCTARKIEQHERSIAKELL